MMELNLLRLSEYNIKELEENDPLPPPSITIMDQKKTFPIDISINECSKQNDNTNYKSRNDKQINNEIKINQKNLMKENKHNIPTIENDMNSLNFENIRLINEYNLKNLDNNKNEINSIRYNTDISEGSDDKRMYNMCINHTYRNRRIFKKNISKRSSRSINRYERNKKINDLKINSLSKLKHDLINNDKIIKNRNGASILSKDEFASNTTSFFYNPKSNNNNQLYIKKKIEDYIPKNILQNSKGRSINYTKKRPNLPKIYKKERKSHLNFDNFQKIMGGDGIFNILKLLDCYDIINLIKTKNKKINLLINKVIEKVYFFKIKKLFTKNNELLDILKYTISKIRIKDTLKIDLSINLRVFKDKFKTNNPLVEPLYFKIIYLYNFSKKIKSKKELMTKEEFDNQNSSNGMKVYDFYSFDLYPDTYKFNSHEHQPIKKKIFISKELPLKFQDNNSIANLQPILPLFIDDKGIINLNLYTADNGFVDPDSINIIMKTYNLNKYIRSLEEKKIFNPRKCDYENICTHWKSIDKYEKKNRIINMVKILFEPFFEIEKINYENIGIIIFKIYLKAVKIGELNNLMKIGIKFKIKNIDEYVENEIKKNNLLFEKRDVLELRIGDKIIYYCSIDC
jgi:hypothetical protein